MKCLFCIKADKKCKKRMAASKKGQAALKKFEDKIDRTGCFDFKRKRYPERYV